MPVQRMLRRFLVCVRRILHWILLCRTPSMQYTPCMRILHGICTCVRSGAAWILLHVCPEDRIAIHTPTPVSGVSCLGSSRVSGGSYAMYVSISYIYTPVSGGSCLDPPVCPEVLHSYTYTCVRRILHSYTYTCVRRILLGSSSVWRSCLGSSCVCVYILYAPVSGGSCLGSSCVSRGSCMGSSLEQNYIHAYIHRSLDSA